MAKTIKFNLILDDYPVRNLEGIQEHFSIEDMLKYFKNGLLLRWLDVRGYESQYDAVAKIKKDESAKKIVQELVKIFEVEIKKENIEKGIKILEYLDEEKELNAIYQKNAFEKKKIIEDYHSGYEKLKNHMVENKDNMAVLKADVLKMEREYAGLFDLNYRAIYFMLAQEVPKAVFVILTKNRFREKWLGEEGAKSILGHMKMNLLRPERLKEILGEDLKIVKRDTQAMWDPIERAEIKIMALKIEAGTFIKNAGEFSEKLSEQDVENKFLLMNGLEYQCNNSNYELLYMEV